MVWISISKDTELICELDYAISFCSMDIIVEKFAFHGNIHVPWLLSASRGNIHIPWIYPHFVYISIFSGNIHIPWILSVFRGNIHVPWILSAFCVYIRILWRLSTFCVNIHVLWILSEFRPFYLSHFTHIVKVTGASLIFLSIT